MTHWTIRTSGRAVGAALLVLGGTPLARRAASAQTQSVLVGTVAGIKPTKRLAGAEVIIATLNRRVRSDSAGAFRVGGLPAGTLAIQVRHKGYALLDTSFVFTGRDTLESQFVLQSADDTLDPTAFKMAEFERRRAKANGWFLTRDDLDDGYDRPLSEVLRRRIPGIAAISNQRGLGVAIASGRGTASDSQLSSGDGYPPACYAQVFVDGVRVFAAGTGMFPLNINEWRTSDIEGIEYYPAAQMTPPEYAGMGSLCGTLSLWLRIS